MNPLDTQDIKSGVPQSPPGRQMEILISSVHSSINPFLSRPQLHISRHHSEENHHERPSSTSNPPPGAAVPPAGELGGDQPCSAASSLGLTGATSKAGLEVSPTASSSPSSRPTSAVASPRPINHGGTSNPFLALVGGKLSCPFCVSDGYSSFEAFHLHLQSVHGEDGIRIWGKGLMALDSEPQNFVHLKKGLDPIYN